MSLVVKLFWRMTVKTVHGKSKTSEAFSKKSFAPSKVIARPPLGPALVESNGRLPDTVCARMCAFADLSTQRATASPFVAGANPLPVSRRTVLASIASNQTARLAIDAGVKDGAGEVPRVVERVVPRVVRRVVIREAR
jgi:hypothetical protein